jgi:deoxyadenosine/deoxycytidine kinase
MRCVYLLEAWRNRANDASSPTPILTVMDHGPIFRLTYLRVFGLSLTKTRRFRRWWDQMLADWSQSLQGIVCLEASNEELIGRVRRRQGRSNRFQARSDSGAQKFLEDYRRGYDEVLSSIARQGGPEVMTFNTQHQSPDEIATAVLAKLGLAKSSPTTVENQAHILNQGR